MNIRQAPFPRAFEQGAEGWTAGPKLWLLTAVEPRHVSIRSVLWAEAHAALQNERPARHGAGESQRISAVQVRASTFSIQVLAGVAQIRTASSVSWQSPPASGGAVKRHVPCLPGRATETASLTPLPYPTVYPNTAACADVSPSVC